MLRIIKMVNLHCVDKQRGRRKIQFQTIFDDICGTKTFKVIEGSKTIEATKGEGNEMFKALREQYPDSVALTVIDVGEKDITWRRCMGHFEILLGGKLYCSCDDRKEVDEAIDELKHALAQ